jgi:ectoine hydroxylase-related dioxygenase (phytanoyl-CoA dioxygenase family)
MRGLTATEKERLSADGFAIIPGILPPGRLGLLRLALARMEKERDSYEAGHRDLVAEMRAAEARGEVIHANTWTHVVMQMYQLWERFPAMRAHSLDPGLGELARSALGVPAVRLWFDQALVKAPGGGPTPLHQDNTYMPIDVNSGGVVTIWAPLTAVTTGMGCLCYLAGSHRGRRLPPVPLREFDDIRPLLDDPSAPEKAISAEVPEGGVVIHVGDVIHGAGPNVTGRPRPAVLTCYFPDGSRRSGPLRQYVADRDGVTVGAPLVGPGFPVVQGCAAPPRSESA